MAGFVLALIVAALAQATPIVLKMLTDQIAVMAMAQPSSDRIRVVVTLAAVKLLMIGILSLAAELGLRQVGERLKVRTEQQLSDTAGAHLINLDVTAVGGSTAMRTRQVQRVDRGAEGLAKMAKTICIDLLPTMISAVMAIGIMMIVDWRIGCVALATLPLYITLAIVQGSKQAGVRSEIKEARETRFSALLSAVSSLEIVHSYVQQRFESRQHAQRSARLAAQENRHHLVNHICDSLKLGIDNLGGTIVVLTSSYLVLHGELPIGAVVLYLGLYRNVSAPIRELHRVYTEYQEALVFSSGLFEVLDTEPAIRTKPHALRLPVTAHGRRICFEAVSFKYSSGATVLHDVNIDLLPGQTTALVGNSGAGKSTIAGLLSRFHDPTCGRVLLDGVDLRDLNLDWLREQIGFVTQSNHVFGGTILENVRYGRPGASDREIADAIQRAGLSDVVASTPAGLSTLVEHLSGGEKQRVALARVFLKDPSILVLDEPTANLDAANVQQIGQMIDELRHNRTVLVIAHDPGLFMTAAQIYVLDHGRVVEHGTDASLRHACGAYARIIEANIEGRHLRRLVESSNGTLQAA